jgi:2-phosphosulfolactate phosphatase
MKSVDVLFTPADFQALNERRLREATCVVFDILRATSSIVTALANGARAVIPVQTIEEALEARRINPSVLLAGERDGYRITAKLTGSIDFDLGNSPREFTSAAVEHKTLVMTTTNGTRALKACLGARGIVAGSFLNLHATIAYLRSDSVQELFIVCSGTHEEASLEDSLAAGALVDALWPLLSRSHLTDSAQMARLTYQRFESDLGQAMTFARNGRRLLGIPELRDDVPFCLQRDIFPLVARLESNGCMVSLS